MTGELAYRALARLARRVLRQNGRPAAFAEYLTRHFLESFVHRLTLSPHAGGFVLKGGVLLAVYGARRPTKDVDSQAISATLTPKHLADVARALAAIDTDDGVEFDTATINVQQIRDEADYPGLRLRMQATLHTAHGTIVWDVSTGRSRAWSRRGRRTSARARPGPSRASRRCRHRPPGTGSAARWWCARASAHRRSRCC